MGDIVDFKTGKTLKGMIGSDIQAYPNQKSLKFIRFFAGAWFGTDYVTLHIVPGSPPAVYVVPWQGSRDKGYSPVSWLRWQWMCRFARKDPGGGSKNTFRYFVAHLERQLGCSIRFVRNVPAAMLKNCQIDKESK